MSGGYSIMQALKADGLTPSERVVYAYLVGRANGAKVCWPGVPEIADDLGMTTRTVINCTKTLRETGRLRIVSRWKDTNHYFVLGLDGIYDDSPRNAEMAPVQPQFEPEIAHIKDIGLDVKKTALELPGSGEKNDTSEPLEQALGGKKPHINPGSGVKKTAQQTIVQEGSKVQGRKSTVLTHGADAPIDVRRELFGIGVATVQLMTGRTRGGCAAFVGKLLKDNGDDCAAVLNAIRRAETHRPIDPEAFIRGCLKKRPIAPDDLPVGAFHPSFVSPSNPAGRKPSPMSGGLF